jgi:hypothetical protein
VLHSRTTPRRASSQSSCVEPLDLASVSSTVRPVSDSVRRARASVSPNVRRKVGLIARRAVHHCASLHLSASNDATHAEESSVLRISKGLRYRGTRNYLIIREFLSVTFGTLVTTRPAEMGDAAPITDAGEGIRAECGVDLLGRRRCRRSQGDGAFVRRPGLATTGFRSSLETSSHFYNFVLWNAANKPRMIGVVGSTRLMSSAASATAFSRRSANLRATAWPTR